MKAGKKGVMELGRGNDGSFQVCDTAVKGDRASGSEEYILESGIYKTTGFIVGHEARDSEEMGRDSKIQLAEGYKE